ncbi:uncharacterized protein LOC127791157 isoform X6 [Diospyros lotus]|uniref:uncharacterized protein LOC127791157 isoform X6 n=1 Tax=Diospyros lotus TaxID=55363 RepID=UPI0022583C61|nr:uncharacterized protein LOC127791157 isoform X6 [Diospyros lotus]
MDSSSAGGSSGKSGNSNSRERERYFDAKAKARCWANAETVPGRHPERWRKDAAGNVVCKRFSNCLGCLCFEYDHIIPYSKGGESVAENCQILQTRVNRFKSDKDKVDATQLRGYSCDIKFTGVKRSSPMSLEWTGPYVVLTVGLDVPIFTLLVL